MNILLRAIAILIELALLGLIAYVMLNGVRLIIFDLGARQKYQKVIVMALVAVGVISVVFFIAHLIAFYPGV